MPDKEKGVPEGPVVVNCPVCGCKPSSVSYANEGEEAKTMFVCTCISGAGETIREAAIKWNDSVRGFMVELRKANQEIEVEKSRIIIPGRA